MYPNMNNILAGMLGNAYLIKKKLQGQPALIDKVENIEELGFRAGDLISQMLAFARKGILEKANSNFVTCIGRATKLAKAALPKEILFNQTIGHDKLMVFADDTLLQQVIINIINNARDAVENASEPEITLVLERQHADSTFKGAHEKAHADNYAKLTISDNGSGMSEEVIEHIFDPFYTTKAINKGTGLGLSMALGTIQSHDGFVDVDSQLDKGTSFYIYLPLLEEAHDEVKKVDISEPAVKENIHILVADDEPHILEMLVEILQEDGYSVYPARDGEEALSVYQEHKSLINLVILDMSMPKMPGVQVAKEIKKSAPNLPIIFNSGYDKSEMPYEIYNCKWCFKLQKPVEINILKQTIYEALELQENA